MKRSDVMEHSAADSLNMTGGHQADRGEGTMSPLHLEQWDSDSNRHNIIKGTVIAVTFRKRLRIDIALIRTEQLVV